MSMIRGFAGAALALVLSAPTVQAQEATPWTGFYAGLNVGYAWGGVDVTDTNGGVMPGPFSYDTKGFSGGAAFGFNRQFDRLVAGIEIEGGYMDLAGHGRIPSSTPPNYQAIDLEGRLYGIIAGRLGIALDHTLIYGKGGWAYWETSAGQKTTKPGYVTHRTDAFSGFVYGGGVEHMLTDRLSLKVEYLRFDFGSQTGDQTSVGDPPIGYKYLNRHDFTADTVKMGLGFKF